MNITAKNFKESIEKANTIAITGHIRPDGDCTGSVLGVAQYIRENFKGKEVVVYLEPIRSSFLFLSGAKMIHNEVDDRDFDLFICCDCAEKKRFGKFIEIYERAKETICIDHHISNDGFANQWKIVPKASSTCEVLYELMEPELISKETATALYLGIVHDTGVFAYKNTNKKTMQIAGELLEKGVDNNYIIDETFYTKTYAQNQILGKALLDSVCLLDGKVIYSYVSKETMAFFKCVPHDLDGIIAQLRRTKGVEVAIFLYEMDLQTYKVSMRSNEKVDVNAIAKYYEGGGHIRASGCIMTGTVHDVINNLMEHIEKQLTSEEI